MMYPHVKIDDCWTYTSREMELNAKSNHKSDGQGENSTIMAGHKNEKSFLVLHFHLFSF